MMQAQSYAKKIRHFAVEQKQTRQECIPVGCVPSAAVAVCWEGGICPRGVCPGGGVCLPRGWCLPGRGVSAQGEGCVCPGGGMSAQGVVSAGEGGCLPRGVYLPRGCLADTPHPVNRMTDRCKNITLPQLRCGR